jgi:hypothetical protein
LQVSV